MDITAIGTIGNVWSFAALVFVYILNEAVKYIKLQKTKKEQTLNDKRNQLLHLLKQPYNEKLVPFIKQLYNEYKALDGNGYIDLLYFEYLESANK